MPTAVMTRKPRGSYKTSDKKRAESEQRKTDIELATKTIDGDEPDFLEFIRRFGKRYGENNLRRLWVQCPNATILHKYGTWQAMGRQVRRGEKAILLRQPHVSHDEDKITPDNPDGEVFHGAPWMSLFDFSQTDPIGAHSDDNADLAALRAAALAAHPDNGGSLDAFSAAWRKYDEAREALNPREKNKGDFEDSRL